MRQSEAITVMELTGNESEKEITKKYRKLALSRHPDKPGGTKEAFQILVSAYELLIKASGTKEASTRNPNKRKKRADPDSDDEYEDSFSGSWGYDFHHDFFSAGGFYSSHTPDNENDWEEFFQQQRETARRRYERQRREHIRQGYDYRDRRGNKDGEDCLCQFCGVNAAIDEESAKSSGIEWEEYQSHPEGYRTCWICKNKHISVMTESMAIKKFAKVLEPKRQGSYGDYRFIFWILRKEHRVFHHQPKSVFCDGPTRNSLYYWYPDLEDAALAAGWKPRGKKKDEVPWKPKPSQIRKELPGLSTIVVSHSTKRNGKKRKRAAISQQKQLGN
jgi:curved DNA-binding protein CbpA